MYEKNHVKVFMVGSVWAGASSPSVNPVFFVCAKLTSRGSIKTAIVMTHVFTVQYNERSKWIFRSILLCGDQRKCKSTTLNPDRVFTYSLFLPADGRKGISVALQLARNLGLFSEDLSFRSVVKLTVLAHKLIKIIKPGVFLPVFCHLFTIITIIFPTKCVKCGLMSPAARGGAN